MPEASKPNLARKLRPYAILIVVTVVVLWKFGGRFKENYFSTKDSQPSITSQTRHIGGFEVLENCQWITNEKNDGDSFLVKHGKSEYTFKVYFVDAPETYQSDEEENQRKGVAKQGKYFGGLSPDQTMEVGSKAKAFSAKRLKGQPFTVLTRWENVANSDRYYAFVWLPGSTEKKQIRLSDALIRNGLASIHVRAPRYQNAPQFNQFEDPQKSRKQQSGFIQRLRSIENQAKQAKAGAWGMGKG